MARYIDAESLYEKLYPLDLVDKRLYTINAKAVADAIANTPTADVVPKSEVEELKKDRYQVLPDGRLELLPRTDIDKIKTEVAREIFEEIESKLTLNKATHCGQKFYYIRLKDDIVELKKKYTEGDNG